VRWELPEDGLAGIQGQRDRSGGELQIFDRMMDMLTAQRPAVA